MKLSDELSRLAQNANQTLPTEIKTLFKDSIDEVKASNIEQTALSTGDMAPDFTLSNANGDTVSLSAFLEKGPVVITFYRGGWCPYCNLELKAYRDALKDITNLNANLIAISPELPDNSLSTIEKNNLNFEVLSDIDNKVAKKFGLVFKVNDALAKVYKERGFDLKQNQGNELNELPMPGTYVIDTTGKIVLSFVNSDYKKRLDIDVVLNKLKEL
ncbi:MAG: peroxiredoxin-like family protein [Clostridium sp.]|uniref:peroxiredoxin-like family protein n=1 Tax=Clostridium sp. TaxID=1506 RepID=UPI003F398E76